jgi:hypothetical protein
MGAKPGKKIRRIPREWRRCEPINQTVVGFLVQAIPNEEIGHDR